MVEKQHVHPMLKDEMPRGLIKDVYGRVDSEPKVPSGRGGVGQAMPARPGWGPPVALSCRVGHRAGIEKNCIVV